MNKNNSRIFLKVALLMGVLFGANNAFACTYQPLVPNILAGADPDTGSLLSPTTNDSVCVDIPNSALAQTGNSIVWDIDLPVTTDGKSNTTTAALRHMYMMANAMEYIIQKVQAAKGVDISGKFHIYGVIHGTALHWALNDAWWKAQVDANGNQLYPNGNPEKVWIDKLQAFAAQYNLDLHLEVCGVTLMGNHLTNANVYPGIKVNGGAFGRFAVLHNEGFLVIQEGWIDNDDAYLQKSANN